MLPISRKPLLIAEQFVASPSKHIGPEVSRGEPRQKKSGHEARFLLVTPDRVAKPLQPIAAVGGVFDDGVRLHEVRIDGADEARTARGEALELLRCIEAIERVPVLEVEFHHGINGQAKTDAEHSGRRRARPTRGATGVSALFNSQNIAK